MESVNSGRPGTPQSNVQITKPEEELFFLSQMLTTKKGLFEIIKEDREILPYVEKNYVFIRDKPAVELLMYEDYKTKAKNKIEEKLRCTFVVTLKPFMKKARAFAYPQNSTLRRLFDPTILKIVEAGIVKFKTNEELPGTKICPLNLNSSERRLRNADLKLTYILAGIGIATAVIALCIEVSYRHRDKFCMPSFMKGKSFDEKNNNTKNRPIGQWSPGPPPYQTIFGQPYGITDSINNKIKNVNGRDYWVVQLPSGDSRLIPIRTPSAFLFQFST